MRGERKFDVENYLKVIVPAQIADQHRESVRIGEQGTVDEWREQEGNFINLADQASLKGGLNKRDLKKAVRIYNQEILKLGGRRINLYDIWGKND